MSIRRWIVKWVLGVDVDRLEQRIRALEGYIAEKELEE